MHYLKICIFAPLFLFLTSCHYPSTQDSSLPSTKEDHKYSICAEIKHKLTFPKGIDEHHPVRWRLPSNQALLMKLYNQYDCKNTE